MLEIASTNVKQFSQLSRLQQITDFILALKYTPLTLILSPKGREKMGFRGLW
jgi:hypothetical protein